MFLSVDSNIYFLIKLSEKADLQPNLLFLYPSLEV